jgi:uncharacterized protein (TIGR00159 family)
MFNFIHFRITDLIDILLVAFILYELYCLLKGTTALKIFWGIALFFLAFLASSLLHFTLFSKIIGQLISVGMIALIVVFQPEIRSFLLYIGNRRFFKVLNGKFIRKDDPQQFIEDIDAIVRASKRMASSQTGALIIMTKEAPLEDSIVTGEIIDARVSRELIENIFFKNSPLHDGAIIIKAHRITAARCILPVSKSENISSDLGLRHRSAIGVTNLTDAIAIVVSEQTGAISLCKEGIISRDISPIVLKQMLTDEFITPISQEQ